MTRSEREPSLQPDARSVPVVLHDLGLIEAELTRLWQANADAGGEAEARPVLRVASFNLVTVVPSEGDSARAAAVLAQVMAVHPGRVLILWVDRAAPDERLEAWVAMHCRPVAGGSQICGEQVVIAARGGAVDRVGGAVAALLVPECPTFVWWRGGVDPAASFLDRLVPIVDAVLLDGARFDPATLPRWVERMATAGAGRPVGDLAWRRGAAWRGWTADCFEPAAMRPHLGGLTRVRVEHGEGAEMVALLHVAWLAARLGWAALPQLARRPGGGWDGRLAHAGATIGVEVALVAGSPGLAAVHLEAAGAHVRCVVARQGPEAVALEVARRDTVLQRRIIRQPEPDEAALVGRWLGDPRRDPIYAGALASLAALTA